MGIRYGVPRQRTTIDAEGHFQEYLEVEFFLDDARYTVKIPSEEFDAAAAKAAVEAKVAQILQVTQKEIKSAK